MVVGSIIERNSGTNIAVPVLVMVVLNIINSNKFLVLTTYYLVVAVVTAATKSLTVF